MKTILRLGLLCGILLVFGADTGLGWGDRLAAESITVETASGRRFRGQLDPGTDSDYLRLRSLHGACSVLRPIRWQRVVQVELAGDSYTGEEFLAAFRAISSTLPPLKRPSRTIRLVGTLEETPPQVAPGALARPRLVSTSPDADPDARVHWIRVDTRVANWDSDGEVDGLVVKVQPLDARGLPAPVDGTLWVNLYGHRNTPVNRPEPPIHLGRWSRRVAAEEFGLHGAAYRFAFEGADPALDLDIAPDGLVSVRLSAPGQGVFETSDCLLRLRPYCSVRDSMFRATGRWYLPIEQTGHGR